MFLGHSRRILAGRLSDPMKKCRGGAKAVKHAAKEYFSFFSRESWHWGSTGGYALKATASMLKNDKAVPNIFVKNVRFSFDSHGYPTKIWKFIKHCNRMRQEP
jgi:hypothetical protein